MKMYTYKRFQNGFVPFFPLVAELEWKVDSQCRVQKSEQLVVASNHTVI